MALQRQSAPSVAEMTPTAAAAAVVDASDTSVATRITSYNVCYTKLLRYLRGTKYRRGPRNPVIGHERLHLWYRSHAPKVEQERLPVADRQTSFDEIMQNLSETDALFESSYNFV